MDKSKKMIVIAIVVLAVFTVSFTGCVSMQGSIGFEQEDKGYTISYKNPLKNFVFVKYESNEFLVDKENIQAAKFNRQPDYKYIPTFGLITANIRGFNASSTGNPKNCYFTITDDTGKEIYKGFGSDSKVDSRIAGVKTGANVATTYNVVSEGIEVFPLIDEPVFPISISVIHPLDDDNQITIKKR